jgi:NADPH:quinone reductase-like Zn-dependent oxidoreductase
MKAVRFDQYGGVDVLKVVDAPGQGEALIKVKAASINPGEAKIRKGLLHARWPATFPSGEGSDFAGIVTKVGPGVGSVKVSDEVIGFTDKRASHAEYVVAEARNLTPKPAGISWEVAGSLAIAGSTAYAAVHAVSLKPGDTVAVSAAAGGVGSIAVQLARRAGAKVIGIASPANHAWLSQHGVEAVAYGEGLADPTAQVRFQCVHRLPWRRLRESGDRTGRAQGPHRHDHRFRRRAAIRCQDRGQPGGAELPDPGGARRTGRRRQA